MIRLGDGSNEKFLSILAGSFSNDYDQGDSKPARQQNSYTKLANPRLVPPHTGGVAHIVYTSCIKGEIRRTRLCG